jgi:dolichol-phosphate mannosyltransferase
MSQSDSMPDPRVSVIVTAKDEGEQIVICLDRILEAVTLPCEVLVVYDSVDDTTRPYAEEYASRDARVHPTLNTSGRGPAAAIKFGFGKVRAGVTVVTMADGCDDPQQIVPLTYLVERGVAIAAASRYMRGGQQIGGPVLKRTLSRAAGISLRYFAGVGTHDATNSFKAYSTQFVRDVGIESDSGFEMGIELVAKAKRLRLPVAEVPTIWLDRTFGVSNFKMMQWLPQYLQWYRFAFGRPLTVEELRQRRDDGED